MIWTLGKNPYLFEESEYIGTAHYRRYLEFQESQLQKNTILANRENVGYSIIWLYNYYHKISDLMLFIEFFNKEFPELSNELYEYMNQNVFYKCNVFIMNKTAFMDYFKFIERCTVIITDKVMPMVIDDLNKRDRYQSRMGAFILERMTSFWIWLQGKNKYNIIDTPLKVVDIDSIYKRQG